MAKKSMKSPLMLLAVGLGAYWLLKPKTAAAQDASAPMTWSPPDFTPTGSTSARWNTEVQVPYRL